MLVFVVVAVCGFLFGVPTTLEHILQYYQMDII